MQNKKKGENFEKAFRMYPYKLSWVDFEKGRSPWVSLGQPGEYPRGEAGATLWLCQLEISQVQCWLGQVTKWGIA